MANNTIYKKTGTAIIFANSTGYSPAARNNLGAKTNNIDLRSLGSNAGRQAAKVDLGDGRAREFKVTAAVDFSVAPTAGRLVKYYWAPSLSTTPANSNLGRTTGSDAAYSGYSSNLSDSVKQLQYIGALRCVGTATVQIGYIGNLKPAERAGNLVVHNDTNQSFRSIAKNLAVRFAPDLDEIQ